MIHICEIDEIEIVRTQQGMKPNTKVATHVNACLYEARKTESRQRAFISPFQESTNAPTPTLKAFSTSQLKFDM
jgi:hypothetical protein